MRQDEEGNIVRLIGGISESDGVGGGAIVTDCWVMRDCESRSGRKGRFAFDGFEKNTVSYRHSI